VLALPNRFVNDVGLPLWRRLHDDEYASAERMRAHVERKLRRPEDPSPPRRFERVLNVSLGAREGWPVYEIRPRAQTARTSIVYLHGGAYVSEITWWHWLLIRQLALEVPARCVVPIYPLAPGATAPDVVRGSSGLVGDILSEQGPEQLVLMGDSAGGGLAVAASLALHDRGLRRPSRLVLISPWLDATVSDERQEAIAPKDRMLRRPGLREAGRLYAGRLEPDDPLVSPINGSIGDLPPLAIFTGTHDILDCDSQRLARMALDEGIAVDLREVAGAPHDFPLMPSRQGAAGRRDIVEICAGVAG
jgi:monoterpene epsilon-lactone hydrolase